MIPIDPPMPVIHRYLRALNAMLKDVDPDNRSFARGAMRDMADTSVRVAEYLTPVMVLPLTHLTGPERRLRLLADQPVMEVA